ncbi:hypothetical protein DYB37_000670 [Aphanomyces astaci]|uniref:Uncharacterized protein n=1 Tax=Aphanomyces astaci TaxID=112090 RepID=A0A3L6VB00_APHAT|nr:hypothetical protein DYB35_001150 [Aphanomyces astaci]RHZ13861.1 hypothetical protein DYB37_000670 [Aphanomyces astaci]RLO05873.1 hypothetical protein DYB28_001437 [Aphanomyces astaci]
MSLLDVSRASAYPMSSSTLVDLTESVTMSRKRRRPESKNLEEVSYSTKLKGLLAEACLSDMNNVVIEKNLIAIAKELAILHSLGLQTEAKCFKFISIAFARISVLVVKQATHKELTVSPASLWESAKWQVAETIRNDSNTLDAEAIGECYANAVRDIQLLWKATVLSKEQGAQLWHDNKPDEAIALLKASEVYMRRFNLKCQKLSMDRALIESQLTPSTKRPCSHTKKVSFADVPSVIVLADEADDRSPVVASKPSKLDALLLRSSRVFPAPSL